MSVGTRDDDKGMALPLVLWIMILGAGFVALMQLSSRETLDKVIHGRNQQVLEAHMEGAFARATYELLKKDPQNRPYKKAFQFDHEGGMQVRINDACGKVDVNWADQALLEAYTLVQGLSTMEARRLVKEVKKARSRQGIPFPVLEEFRQLLPTMVDKEWAEFAQGLTTHCPTTSVDPALASKSVKQALTRLGLAEARKLSKPSARQFYEITVWGRLGKTRISEVQGVALLEEPGKPYLVLSQQRFYGKVFSP